jgi:hypothetical protein
MNYHLQGPLPTVGEDRDLTLGMKRIPVFRRPSIDKWTQRVLPKLEEREAHGRERHHRIAIRDSAVPNGFHELIRLGLY